MGCGVISRRGHRESAHPKHNVLNHIEVTLAAIELHPPVLFAPIGVLHS
jgi:hypothetical protein